MERQHLVLSHGIARSKFSLYLYVATRLKEELPAKPWPEGHG
jgi:hypothetical protein